MEPILQIKNVKKYYPLGGFLSGNKSFVKAVDNVSLDIEREETLGLVGESGCGKTTLGKTILRLIEPTSGKAIFEGRDLFQLKAEEMKKMRRSIQMILQDPYSSLDPRFTIKRTLEEPFIVHNLGNKKENEMKIRELLNKVGLDEGHLFRLPHEFSGGQRQRIAILRSLTLNPKFLILDEPTSALDVSVQAQILNLLKELQAEFGLTYMFISHDLSVVKHMANRIAVMYAGHIVEVGMAHDLFEAPMHPYTQALLSVIPTIDSNAKKEKKLLKGSVPSLIDPPSGCRFHPRCDYCMEICKIKSPPRVEIKPSHYFHCHRV